MEEPLLLLLLLSPISTDIHRWSQTVAAPIPAFTGGDLTLLMAQESLNKPDEEGPATAAAAAAARTTERIYLRKNIGPVSKAAAAALTLLLHEYDM